MSVPMMRGDNADQHGRDHADVLPTRKDQATEDTDHGADDDRENDRGKRDVHCVSPLVGASKSVNGEMPAHMKF